MPVITVLSADWPFQATTNEMEIIIREVVSSVKGLQIKPKDVTVFFPADRRLERGGSPVDHTVVARIDGLFVRPSRTDKVRQELAKVVGRALSARVASMYSIEVFVTPFNPSQGFWSSM